MNAQTTMNTSVIGATKQSKVERYGWKLVDKFGESMQIHKDKLLIDESYQRSATQAKVRNIANKWSWIACGSLIVGSRDGQYYLIDGGHRVMAARLREVIGNFPALYSRRATSSRNPKDS
jgi:hypothetical protein